MSILINGEEQEFENSKNYMYDNLKHLYARQRTKNEIVSNIVIHETAGNRYDTMIQTLQQKGLGIHFAIDRDGFIYQHADPVLHLCYHAKGFNKKSIGIEIINPYFEDLARLKTAVFLNFKKRPWWFYTRVHGRYVCPTNEQLNSLRYLVAVLCNQIKTIPFKFPTIANTNKIFVSVIKPGIVSHCDFGKHNDGRWPLEWIYNEINSTITMRY